MRSLDSPRFDEPALSAEDRNYASSHNRFRCPCCFDWVDNWCKRQHLLEHEFARFRAEYPNRLHTELRGCNRCEFVTDCDSEMVGHLQRIHHQTATLDQDIRGRRPRYDPPHLDLQTGSAIHISSDPAADLVSQNIHSRRPSLDATRDYGYPAREQGKHGSHPAHDDFSDESGPNSGN